VWAMCYSFEQARHISAPNPSNTLFIRKSIDSGRQAIIEKGGKSACEQYIILLNKLSIRRICARSEQYTADS
jgi:hypothetical protein